MVSMKWKDSDFNLSATINRALSPVLDQDLQSMISWGKACVSARKSTVGTDSRFTIPIEVCLYIVVLQIYDPNSTFVESKLSLEDYSNIHDTIIVNVRFLWSLQLSILRAVTSKLRSHEMQFKFWSLGARYEQPTRDVLWYAPSPLVDCDELPQYFSQVPSIILASP